MTIATANQQTPRKFSNGYSFARACMRQVATSNMLTFEPRDEYMNDVRDDYQIPLLETAMIMLMDPQKSRYSRISYPVLSDINMRSEYRDYCIGRLCPICFVSGYSSINFLNYLAWITQSAVDLRRMFFRDHFLDAMLVIGDALDIFMEIGEFEFAGGWEDLFDTAQKLNPQTVSDYVSNLERISNDN